MGLSAFSFLTVDDVLGRDSRLEFRGRYPIVVPDRLVLAADDVAQLLLECDPGIDRVADSLQPDLHVSRIWQLRQFHADLLNDAPPVAIRSSRMLTELAGDGRASRERIWALVRDVDGDANQDDRVLDRLVSG